MQASFFSTTDQHKFQTPHAWDMEIYALQPRDFWFSKATLPILPGCELVRYDFRGRVRFRASLNAPRLQINFIDSYSAMDSRLQGMGKIESVVMVTVGGNAWDGLTDVGALGIEVNFDETLANRILDPELLYALNSLISAERSVVGPVTRCGQQLKNLAQRYLNQLGQDAQLFTPDRIGRDHDLLRLDAQDPQPESEDTLVEMARTVLEELALTRLDKNDVGSTRRRDIALKVEEMLWQPPFLQDEAFSATLEEFAALFNVSTRTIQIAVQEQFGMGFVALRRLVRLTQLRGAMIEAGGAASLSALATDYRLHFGRLGQEYSQLFGLKPSEELRRLRRQ